MKCFVLNTLLLSIEWNLLASLLWCEAKRMKKVINQIQRKYGSETAEAPLRH